MALARPPGLLRVPPSVCAAVEAAAVSDTAERVETTVEQQPGRAATVEDILEVADIVDIVGEHVPLKRSGKDFRGPCPFHSETSPSFYVMPLKRLFYCFGCKAAGNAVQFVQKVFGLSFHEAATRVASRYGLQYTGGRQRPEEVSQRERIVRLNGQAARFYAKVLPSAEGQAGRDYIARRGINAESVERFHLGYSTPEWDHLTRSVLASGKSKPRDLVEAGLAAMGQSGKAYDRFRGRVLFPITTLQGEVVGFGARALGDEEPKYLNTSETPVFSKGKLLYGLEQAREAVRRSGTAVIVEGYTDVIACHQAGRQDVLATLGTALTPDHVRLLSRLAQRIIMAFDADSAGQGAVTRSAEALENAPTPVFVAVLPEGEDPDSLVRSRGIGAFESRLQAAIPLMEFAIDRLAASHTDERGLQMDRASENLAQLLAAIHNPSRREQLVDYGAKRLAEGQEARVPRLSQALRAQVSGEVRRRLARERSPRPEGGRGGGRALDTGAETARAGVVEVAVSALRAERALLGAALADATQARWILAEVPPDEFLRPESRELAAAIARAVEGGAAIVEASLVQVLSEPGIQELGFLAAPSIHEAESETTVRQSIDALRDYREEQRYLELKERVARTSAVDQRNSPDVAEFQELSRRRHAGGGDRFSPGTGG